MKAPPSHDSAYGVGGIIASPVVIATSFLRMRTIRSNVRSDRSPRGAAESGVMERSRTTRRESTSERERMAVVLL